MDRLDCTSQARFRRKAMAADSEEKSDSVLATLERGRAALLAHAGRETAELVALTILQLRMKLNRIAESELKALCDAMMGDRKTVRVGPSSGPRLRLGPIK
jgi:hypothetical protein